MGVCVCLTAARVCCNLAKTSLARPEKGHAPPCPQQSSSLCTA